MSTTLLGPQRFRTTVREVVRSLGVDGPIAVIASGWEERESDDGELDGQLDGRCRNLRLYHRLVDVLTKDTVFAAGALRFREQWEELRSFYGVRLQAAVDAAHAVLHRSSPHGIKTAAFASAVQAVRDVDEWYAATLKQLYRELGTSVRAEESPVVGWHRGEIDAMLRDCPALVLPGGHVGVLLQSLRLFAITVPPELPVVAWSAGAMALTERVVLFHDHTPQEVTAAEYFDRGLARVPGVIALPHAKRRLRLDDRERVAVLARRFAPKQLLLLDDGAIVRFPTGSTQVPPGARVLGPDGTVRTVETSATGGDDA